MAAYARPGLGGLCYDPPVDRQRQLSAFVGVVSGRAELAARVTALAIVLKDESHFPKKVQPTQLMTNLLLLCPNLTDLEIGGEQRAPLPA